MASARGRSMIENRAPAATGSGFWAFECLTRPVHVQIHTRSEYLRDEAANPVDNVDLWRRLAAAIEQHDIEWCWSEDNARRHGHLRAVELAAQELAQAAAELPVPELRDDS